jgi:hypothetical protein
MGKVRLSSVTVKVKTTGPAAVTVKVTQTRPAPLTIVFPYGETIPPFYRGKPYVLGVNDLLTPGDANPKLRKSEAAGTRYRTWGLSLAPAKESGYQTCSSSSEGCRRACLFHQGRGQCGNTAAARIARTIAFMEHRDWFEVVLQWELDHIDLKGHQEGFIPALRLNIVSDVLWERVFPWLFSRYPDAQFYDYTKHVKRMLAWCREQLPPNYHLTFSRSEVNEPECLQVLQAGGNVAVVFREEFPAQWQGYAVTDGDQTDLRFLDPKGVVIGLSAKGTSRHDNSGFVVDTHLGESSVEVCHE